MNEFKGKCSTRILPNVNVKKITNINWIIINGVRNALMQADIMVFYLKRWVMCLVCPGIASRILISRQGQVNESKTLFSHQMLFSCYFSYRAAINHSQVAIRMQRRVKPKYCPSFLSNRNRFHFVSFPFHLQSFSDNTTLHRQTNKTKCTSTATSII